MRRRQQLKLEVGQVLVVVAVALPLFFSVCAFVVDGSNLMVHRRAIQNASDAAALAAAQDLAAPLYQNMTPDPSCSGWAGEKAARQAIVDRIEEYSAKNGGPTLLDGGSCSFDPTRCNSADEKNCYTWPYQNDKSLVEVRLRESVGGFFASVAHLSLFKVSARAVASTNPVVQTTTTTIPGTTINGTTINGTTIFGTTNPGTTIVGTTTYANTYTDTVVTGGNGGVGFAMSENCVFDQGGAAITYNGAGGDKIGALETNGGIKVQGASGKIINRLSLGRNGEVNSQGKPCYDNFDSKGKEIATITNKPVLGPFSPKPWPNPPPPVPTPPGGCTNLGNLSIIFTTSGHPPGFYCLTGTTATLSLSGCICIGYTFFAPSISVSGGTYTCYLFCPSGATPGTAATLFFATVGSISVQGGSPSLTGNVYAPSPNAEISFTGGGVGGGKGFLEAWTLKLAGNFANYQGTGGGGGTASTSTTTVSTTYTTPTTTVAGTTNPGATTSGVTVPGTTVSGGTSTNSTTVGNTIGLGE